MKQVSKRLDYNQIAPEGLEALGGVHRYIAQSSLPATLVDLVYPRVSQINNCAYCLDTHTRDLLRKEAKRQEARAGAGLVSEVTSTTGIALFHLRFRKLPMAPGMRCRTGFSTPQHFHQRDK